MSDMDGGMQPLSPLGTEPPGLDLKSKGTPWPVTLAIVLAVLVAAAFLGIRSYQSRQKRKVHVAFMEQFVEFEKNDVNAFWRCLFGKEGDARRFTTPEQLNAQLESTFFTDPKGFPEKVQVECAPKALSAAKKVKHFDPVPPQEYDTVMENYGKALGGLANAINQWAEGAPRRVEARMAEVKLKEGGDAWSNTQNVKKPDPKALMYHRFIHCAVPNLDKLKDGQALLEFLAAHCVGKHRDPEFLTKLRDKCLPESQQAGDKVPANFKQTLAKLVEDYDRETQAWDACFREMRKLSKKDDLNAFDQAWAAAINASTEVRKIGKENLPDE